jgi:hypothetical protein
MISLKRLLPVLVLFVTGIASAQNCTQFPNSIACLPKVLAPNASDMIVDDQGASTPNNPGTVTLALLSNFFTGPGGVWTGSTIGVPFGGTGSQFLSGPLKGNGAGPFSSAASADITGLWSGTCSATTFLRGDGLCVTPSGTGGTVTSSGSPTVGNVAAFTTATNITPAVAANIYGLWTGSCTNATYLRGDGACATPAGSGTVTNATAPSWLTVTGGSTATLNFAATTGLTGNQFLATPAGATGGVALRSIVAGDLPLISLVSGVTGVLPAANISVIPLTSGVTGILPANSGGTGKNNGSSTLTITGGAATLATPPSGNIGLLEAPPVAAGTPCLAINYTALLIDSAHMICNSSASAVTFTIPANASVGYPNGTWLFFLNPCSMGTVTIAITTDTLSLSPNGLTGSRTLAACGTATAFKYGTTTWMIWGSGLTRLLAPESIQQHMGDGMAANDEVYAHAA